MILCHGKIQGYWSGLDRKYDTYFDINNFQIIVRENKSADECPVRYLFDYSISEDTLILNNSKYKNFKIICRF